MQAVGQLPVDFARSRRDRADRDRPQDRRPTGSGLLLLERGAEVVPLQFGGGQERGRPVRHPRRGRQSSASRWRSRRPSPQPAGPAVRLAGLRDRLIAGIADAVPDVVLSGDPGASLVDDGPSRLPGNAHLRFPGCEGDSLLMLLDAQGIECSTGLGLHGRGATARRTCCWPWASTSADARGALRFSFGHTSTGRRRAGGAWTAIGPVGRAVPRARRSPATQAAADGRVIAAMSGGVDSAVAAALAVDAGHEVVGVHMALSRTPGTLRTGSRGCCTVEDAFDARRVCDLLDIPYYVWDFSDDFVEDVVADFLAEYAAGRTPNPCLRCNEKIKFAALLDRAVALGFDAVVTGHHARLAGRRAVPVRGRGQGPVLRAGRADPGTVGAQPVPARRHDQGAGPGGGGAARLRGRRQAGLVRHLLHPGGRHPRLSGRQARRRPGSVVDAETGERLGRHDGYFGFTIGQRKGLGVRTPGRGRAAAVRARRGAGQRHRARSDRRPDWTSRW